MAQKLPEEYLARIANVQVKNGSHVEHFEFLDRLDDLEWNGISTNHEVWVGIQDHEILSWEPYDVK